MKVPTVTKSVALAMALGVVTTATAGVILNPGGGGAPMVDTLAVGPLGSAIAFYSSPVVQDDLGKFTAQVDSAVTQGNSYGATALTFWYRLTNVDQTPDGNPLTALSVPLILPAQVKVDQTVAGPYKSQAAVNTGGAVTFSWIFKPIPELGVSGWQAIETPFINYVYDYVGVVNGAGEDVDAIVPGDKLIPEPSTYAGLFALGLAGFAAYRRFRA